MNPPRRRGVAVDAVATGLIAALAVGGALSTPIRPILVRAEPLLAPGLFLFALGLGTASRGPVRFRRAARRAQRGIRRALRVAGIPAAMLCFLLPLWAALDLQPSGAASATAALVGRLPQLDARGHLEGALKLLADGAFDDFSARRPLNACWLAVRLALSGGSLAWALGVQAMLLGGAVGAAARVIAVRYGVATMLAFVALMQGLLRDYAAAVLTEPLGAALAALGFAVLLGTASRPRLASAAAGLLLVEMALHARPGAQLLGPAIAVWVVRSFPGRRAAAAVVAVGCLAANALLTTTLNAVHGPPAASFSSYPAYTAYGLVSGSSYRGALEDHGAALAALPDERARARYLYRAAGERLAASPLVLLATLGENVLDFLRKLLPNLGRIVDPAMLAVGPRDQVILPRHLRITHPVLGLPILALCVAGWARRLRRAPADERRLWAAAVAAVLGSAAVIQGDAGFRGLAAAYPVIAVLLAMGVSPRRRIAAGDERPLARAALVTAGALAAASVVGPALAAAAWPRPPMASLTSSAAPAEHVIRIDGASPLVVVWNSPPADLAPFAVSRRQFHRAIELGGARNLDELRQLDPPVLLVTAFDHASRRLVDVAGEPAVARLRGRFVRVRGHSTGEITHATGWEVIDGGPAR